MDKRYGRQFAAQSWEEELSATIVGIEKYLGSGLVKGIGPKFAKLVFEWNSTFYYPIMDSLVLLC